MILLLLLARSTTKCGFVVKVNNKINVESPKKQVTIAVPNSNELRFTVELGWLNAAVLAGFVLFKECSNVGNKEQKWQFLPQIKNIMLHF